MTRRSCTECEALAVDNSKLRTQIVELQSQLAARGETINLLNSHQATTNRELHKTQSKLNTAKKQLADTTQDLIEMTVRKDWWLNYAFDGTTAIEIPKRVLPPIPEDQTRRQTRIEALEHDVEFWRTAKHDADNYSADLRTEIGLLKAPVDDDKENFHFEDEAVELRIVGTDYVKDRLHRFFHTYSCAEKWSLYRAIAKLVVQQRADASKSS